jgi:hypothetical protein
MAKARLAWARAEAYDRRFATVAPYERKLFLELHRVGSSLAVTANEVSAAEDGLWGPVADRPYVLVRGPDVVLKDLPPDARPGSNPEVLGLIEPLHMRNRPATVAELRAF